MSKKIKVLEKLSFKNLLFLGVFVAVLINYFFAFKMPARATLKSENSGSKWMSKLSGDTNLCDINMPGTHNSGSTYTVAVVTGVVASCQDDTIPEQLQKGIRYLDIRCDNDLNINHGGVICYSNVLTIDKYKVTFPKLLDDIEKFLEENPTETVLLQLKKEGGGKGNFLENINGDLKSRKKVFRSENPCISGIKLDDVRGKIVILSRVNGVNVPYRFSGWMDNCTYWNSRLAGASLVVQDNYKAKTHKEKLDVIKSFYEKIWREDLKNKFVINFTSCVGPYCPELIANKINPEFETYLKQHKNKKFGIVLMDVPKETLISEIYNSNF